MFLVHELVHLVHLSTALGYFPSFLAWMREEMEQTHEGHITIIPHLSFSALMQMFSNPSMVRLKWCTRQGEIACYQYLDQIRVRTGVERALNAAVTRLRETQKPSSMSLDSTLPTPLLFPDNQPTVGAHASMGRFVNPPNEASIPRPVSPPPSSPGQAQTSPKDSASDESNSAKALPANWARFRSSSNPWRFDRDVRPATPFNSNIVLTPLSATPRHMLAAEPNRSISPSPFSAIGLAAPTSNASPGAASLGVPSVSSSLTSSSTATPTTNYSASTPSTTVAANRAPSWGSLFTSVQEPTTAPQDVEEQEVLD